MSIALGAHLLQEDTGKIFLSVGGFLELGTMNMMNVVVVLSIGEKDIGITIKKEFGLTLTPTNHYVQNL